MSASISVVTFKIDEKDVSARSDETILEVARQNGIFIPTLCYLEGLTPIGACRLCMVEIKGSPKLFPSCVTRVAEGIEVITDSKRLYKYRLRILEFLFSERNHICSVCVSNGHCELQTLAEKLGLTHVRVPYLYPNQPVDASTSDLSWIITDVSYAHVASEYARKLRALIPGISCRGGLIPVSLTTLTAGGVNRKPAPAAGNAFMSVRLALCSKKENRPLKC